MNFAIKWLARGALAGMLFYLLFCIPVPPSSWETDEAPPLVFFDNIFGILVAMALIAAGLYAALGVLYFLALAAFGKLDR